MNNLCAPWMCSLLEPVSSGLIEMQYFAFPHGLLLLRPGGYCLARMSSRLSKNSQSFSQNSQHACQVGHNRTLIYTCLLLFIFISQTNTKATACSNNLSHVIYSFIFCTKRTQYMMSYIQLNTVFTDWFITSNILYITTLKRK